MSQARPEIKASEFLTFLKKGYLIRELIFRGVQLKLWSALMARLKYRFFAKGKGVMIDHRAVIDGCRFIELGDQVWVQRQAWLAVPLLEIQNVEARPYLKIGARTRIGPACTFSATQKIEIGQSVLFGPNVIILDHHHIYNNIEIPIMDQGLSAKGSISIGDHSWVGSNTVIYSANRHLSIGRHCVIGANSFVNTDIPDFSIATGNPAKVVSKFNKETQTWDKV